MVCTMPKTTQQPAVMPATLVTVITHANFPVFEDWGNGPRLVEQQRERRITRAIIMPVTDKFKRAA
jgi:hypothetical protein